MSMPTMRCRPTAWPWTQIGPNFWRKNHVLIGISLDGTKGIYDRLRIAPGQVYLELRRCRAAFLCSSMALTSICSVLWDVPQPEALRRSIAT